MNDDTVCSAATCSHYSLCYKRRAIQQALPTVNFAEVLLGKAPKQRIEKAGEAAAADLGKRVSEWVGKWCPDRDGAKKEPEAA